jgi:LPS O-antigen subunit length determinant protein (WzzB/FepE family)
VEREIELEQKKIKQEKYKQYVKNKQDQEEWEKREKHLEVQATEFNRYRLLVTSVPLRNTTDGSRCLPFAQ